MANKKTSSSNKPGEPKASRPRIPREYGVTRDKKGLLPWSHVNERMTKAKQYWVCTVSPEGRPHATPVDGLWLDGRLYFGGSPKTRWMRNVAANPAVSIHLESASEVIILEGEAHMHGQTIHWLSGWRRPRKRNTVTPPSRKITKLPKCRCFGRRSHLRGRDFQKTLRAGPSRTAIEDDTCTKGQAAGLFFFVRVVLNGRMKAGREKGPIIQDMKGINDG